MAPASERQRRGFIRLLGMCEIMCLSLRLTLQNEQISLLSQKVRALFHQLHLFWALGQVSPNLYSLDLGALLKLFLRSFIALCVS